MKNVHVRVQLSEQQKAYLDIISKTLRADPGEVLLALAFGLVELNERIDGDKPVDSWLQLLREFVDERKVPCANPTELERVWCDTLGRRTVEVPSV